MNIETTYLKEVFEAMMIQIRAIYDPVIGEGDEQTRGEKPYFMYGRKEEICNLLTDKDDSDEYKFKKYPLIILYHSQPEKHVININTEYLVDSLVSIVTDSERTFRTDDRYTNTIKPILYPIYKLLLQEIADNPAFYQTWPEEIIHELKVWDGNPADDKKAGIMLNDYLDGIDIKFTGLRLFKTIESCPETFSK